MRLGAMTCNDLKDVYDEMLAIRNDFRRPGVCASLQVYATENYC